MFFVLQIAKGNGLGGTFALELDGYVTDDLAYDASAVLVGEALEDLNNVGSISVTRCDEGHRPKYKELNAFWR